MVALRQLTVRRSKVNLLFFLDSDQGGTVDEGQLQKLENSVANAKKDVNQHLQPRLRDMEDREAAYLRHLTGIDHDIEAILRDITNLDDILAAIPKGCFNSPPIEEA